MTTSRAGESEVLVSQDALHLRWLLDLRWVAAAAQLVVILGASLVLDLDLPVGWLLWSMTVGIASNLWWRDRLRRGSVGEGSLVAVMALDIVLLTAMLYLTGGPFNPFSILYLVNIALGAVVLAPRRTWMLAASSLVAFGLLFVVHRPLPGEATHGAGHEGELALHLKGMWLAFGLTAAAIVHFIQRVTGALAEREAALARARAASVRGEQLAALATLAAGAAHELATPLSTIAVAAKELERGLERRGADGETIGDARLIRSQVDRCRGILDRMAAGAGEARGEELAATDGGEIVDLVLGELAPTDFERVRVDRAETGANGSLVVPVHAVGQALDCVVRNALQASAGVDRHVEIRIHHDARSCCFEVTDRGAGMSTEVLARAGEPFFTTKSDRPTGERGMGLGLFVARSVLERLGGRLDLESREGVGTTVRLILPLAANAAPRGRS